MSWKTPLVNQITTPTPHRGRRITREYDSLDRLTAWNGQATTIDADGNLTDGPIGGAMTALTYDKRNRLTAVGGVTYTYDKFPRVCHDADGRARLVKRTGPAETVLAEAAHRLEPDHIYDLSLTAHGGELRATLDGAPLLAATDVEPGALTGGAAAFLLSVGSISVRNANITATL